MQWIKGPLIGFGLAASIFFFFGPVVMLYEARSVTIAGDTVEADIYARKVRDCRYVPSSEIGWERRGGIWFEVEFQFLNDRTPDSTRPRGRQSFGVWQWSGVSDLADAVKVTNENDCGLFGLPYIKLTTNGPFEI